MNANWWGLLGERINKLLGRLAPGETISGIPGSGFDLDGYIYLLIDEKVAEQILMGSSIASARSLSRFIACIL